ncbi:MAG: 5-formyltetrahydrofolate cyclo-ligase [Candidatus Aquicultorales bacterium]
MKEQIRAHVLELRNAMNEDDRLLKSDIISRRVAECPEFEKAALVMTYAAFGSEVSTETLANFVFSSGKRLFLPVIAEERRLLAVEVDGSTPLVKGPFGIEQPPLDGAIVVEPSEIDLVVVPGVVFDTMGYRIGYGGGYYDRFLRLLREDACSVGVSFDKQMADRLPVEEHDQAVSLVVTESRVIYCGKTSP